MAELHDDAIFNEAGQIIKGGCIVVGKSGQILMVEYRHENFYGFPKGHSFAGENPIQTAVRETLEETGYEVEVIKQLPNFVYQSGWKNSPVCVEYFLARPGSGGATSDEIWHWVSFDEVAGKLRPDAADYWTSVRPDVEAVKSV